MCTLTIKYNADNALAQSLEELNASIDEAEESVANGEIYDHDEVMAYFDNYITERAKLCQVQ